MALYKSNCGSCGRTNVDLFTHNDKCLTCTRLDVLELKVEKLLKEVADE